MLKQGIFTKYPVPVLTETEEQARQKAQIQNGKRESPGEKRGKYTSRTAQRR
jgi:hypothetical protein